MIPNALCVSFDKPTIRNIVYMLFINIFVSLLSSVFLSELINNIKIYKLALLLQLSV